MLELGESMGESVGESVGASVVESMEDAELFSEIRRLFMVSTPRVAARRRIEWTSEHDEKIIEAMQLRGVKWREISREVGFGSEDAVRNRVLRMDVSKLPPQLRGPIKLLQRPVERHERKRHGSSHSPYTPYTPDEDAAIWDEIENSTKASMSWKRLSREVLPHRSSQSIRNRAYRLVTMRARRGQTDH